MYSSMTAVGNWDSLGDVVNLLTFCLMYATVLFDGATAVILPLKSLLGLAQTVYRLICLDLMANHLE